MEKNKILTEKGIIEIESIELYGEMRSMTDFIPKLKIHYKIEGKRRYFEYSSHPGEWDENIDQSNILERMLTTERELFTTIINHCVRMQE